MPAKAPASTEKEWQAFVVGLAKLFRWRLAHFRPAYTGRGWKTAMTGDVGFPDLVLVRPPRVIFAELKAGAAVRAEQQVWLDQLGSVPGVEAYVWRPADRDRVLEVLK